MKIKDRTVAIFAVVIALASLVVSLFAVLEVIHFQRISLNHEKLQGIRISNIERSNHDFLMREIRNREKENLEKVREYADRAEEMGKKIKELERNK